jgi:tetratricopeptide (TPR) repeat protein
MSLSCFFARAKEYSNEKQYDEALVWYDKCLERDPNYIAADNNKGNALCSLKRSDEALVWYDKCLERDPNYIYALSGKGSALRDLKRYDEALVWFDKCLERDPNHAFAKRNRDLALAQIDRYKAAYAAGCAHCDRQDYVKAVAEFDKCLALSPSHVRAHHGKGLALKRLQRHDEAILCSEKCLELDGDFLLSHCRHRTLAIGFDLIVGEEDLAGLVSWFMTTLDLQSGNRPHFSVPFPSHNTEETAVEYSLRLFQAGFHSVGILNACRRSRVLTADHLKDINWPRVIELFLLSAPDPTEEPIGTHAEVKDLKEWLKLSLGGLQTSFLDIFLFDFFSLSLCLSLPVSHCLSLSLYVSVCLSLSILTSLSLLLSGL